MIISTLFITILYLFASIAGVAGAVIFFLAWKNPNTSAKRQSYFFAAAFFAVPTVIMSETMFSALTLILLLVSFALGFATHPVVERLSYPQQSPLATDTPEAAVKPLVTDEDIRAASDIASAVMNENPVETGSASDFVSAFEPKGISSPDVVSFGTKAD